MAGAGAQHFIACAPHVQSRFPHQLQVVGNRFPKRCGQSLQQKRRGEYGTLGQRICRMLGGDFSYSTQSHYSINNFNGTICDKDIEGAKSRRIYANGYFVFNNRKFSYPAALTQSYRQKRSCGSVIAGVSFFHNTLELNPEALSAATEGRIPATSIIQRSAYDCLNINCGYAYNWVPDSHWMLHGTALPALSFMNRLEYRQDGSTFYRKNEINIGGIVRFGTLWNHKRYYEGFTALMYIFGTRYNPMSMTDMYAKIQMSFGVRF